MSAVLTATERLGDALEAIAGALADGDEPRLTSAEAVLASALGDLGRLHLSTGQNRDALIVELTRARAALQRCRRLGLSGMDVVRATLVSHGRVETYGRGGAAALTPAGVRDFSTRI